jgi:hypothetical protein
MAQRDNRHTEWVFGRTPPPVIALALLFALAGITFFIGCRRGLSELPTARQNQNLTYSWTVAFLTELTIVLGVRKTPLALTEIHLRE